MSIKATVSMAVLVPVLIALQACANTSNEPTENAKRESYEAPVTRTGSNIARGARGDASRVSDMDPAEAQRMREEMARTQGSITPLSNR